MQKFVPANIGYMQYRTLEYVDQVPFPSTNRKSWYLQSVY